MINENNGMYSIVNEVTNGVIEGLKSIPKIKDKLKEDADDKLNLYRILISDKNAKDNYTLKIKANSYSLQDNSYDFYDKLELIASIPISNVLTIVKEDCIEH
jgi:hypothetical protein